MSLDLRKFLSLLRKSNQLIDVEVPVDPNLELAEIHRRVINEGEGLFYFIKFWDLHFPSLPICLEQGRELTWLFLRAQKLFLRTRSSWCLLLPR